MRKSTSLRSTRRAASTLKPLKSKSKSNSSTAKRKSTSSTKRNASNTAKRKSMNSLKNNNKRKATSNKSKPTRSRNVNVTNYQNNKWNQYQLFSKIPELIPYLPESRLMSLDNLIYYLDQYGECVAKLKIGSLGRGFYSISQEESGFITIKYLDQTITVNNVYELYKFFSKFENQYFLQRKVHLTSVNNGITDVRVILQKMPDLQWQVTGKCVKIAPPSFVVTYTGQPGREVNTIDCLCSEHGITKYTTEQLNKELDKLAYYIINTLKPHLKTKILGLDIGIDINGQFWLIEAANTQPDLRMFTNLKNKDQYYTILRYKKLNLATG